MLNIKRFIPIRIFHLYYGYGWWWANYFFFFGKYHAPFAIMPMDREMHCAEYASNGNEISHGDTDSWSEERQQENAEPHHQQNE